MGAQETLAGAITALAEDQAGARMVIGVSTAVSGQVKVGGSTFIVARWAAKPTVAGRKVLLLMQGGSVVAIGLDP